MHQLHADHPGSSYHLKLFNLIISAELLLPWKVTHSRFPGLECDNFEGQLFYLPVCSKPVLSLLDNCNRSLSGFSLFTPALLPLPSVVPPVVHSDRTTLLPCCSLNTPCTFVPQGPGIFCLFCLGCFLPRDLHDCLSQDFVQMLPLQTRAFSEHFTHVSVLSSHFHQSLPFVLCSPLSIHDRGYRVQHK